VGVAPWRVRLIRRVVSLVLAVFRSRPRCTAGRGAGGVRRPSGARRAAEAPSRAEARKELGVDGDAPVVGLLPAAAARGQRVLPTMREATLVAAAHPDARFLWRRPHGRREDLSADGGRRSASSSAHYTVMRAADLLLVTSGTATSRPRCSARRWSCATGFRASPSCLFKPLVRVRGSASPTSRSAARWCRALQRALTGEALGRAPLRLLDSPARWPDSARRSASWRPARRRASARAPRVTCSIWPRHTGAHEHAAGADAARGGASA